jgi:hypothetical protein
MPASSRRVTLEDLLSNADYERERTARRAALLPGEALRRVTLGPYCTLTFETYDTLLFRLQETLLGEKGAAAQVEDKVAAYNRLIPQESELVATAVFEIDDPAHRSAILGQLGGIEDQFYVQIDVERVYAAPGGGIEPPGDGTAVPVPFVRFRLTPDDAAAFGDYERPVMIGCDHPLYRHLSLLSEEARAELAKDLER